MARPNRGESSAPFLPKKSTNIVNVCSVHTCVGARRSVAHIFPGKVTSSLGPFSGVCPIHTQSAVGGFSHQQPPAPAAKAYKKRSVLAHSYS